MWGNYWTKEPLESSTSLHAPAPKEGWFALWEVEESKTKSAPLEKFSGPFADEKTASFWRFCMEQREDHPSENGHDRETDEV